MKKSDENIVLTSSPPISPNDNDNDMHNQFKLEQQHELNNDTLVSDQVVIEASSRNNILEDEIIMDNKAYMGQSNLQEEDNPSCHQGLSNRLNKDSSF